MKIVLDVATRYDEPAIGERVLRNRRNESLKLLRATFARLLIQKKYNKRKASCTKNYAAATTKTTPA